MRTGELFDLSGRTALVTGGGRGLGRQLALGLAEAGADVVAAGRELGPCRETADAAAALGRRAWALRADVSRPDSIDALVGKALSAAGRIDVLVNNAGRVWAAPLLEHPLEGWDRVFDLNVRGLFWLSRQVARHMVEGGGGSIVNLSSVSAWLGAPDAEQPVVSYMASKGAVEALTRDMAVKLAPRGVRVNAIAPGPFTTDMMRHLSDDPARLARYAARIPAGRVGGDDDLKGAVVFLASDASAFVTGQTLVVDGGVSALYPIRPD